MPVVHRIAVLPALVLAFLLSAVPASAENSAVTPGSAISTLTGQVTSWGGVAVAVVLAMIGFAIIRKLLRTSK